MDTLQKHKQREHMSQMSQSPQERQEAAVEREFDRMFAFLSSPEVTVWDIQKIFVSLSEESPEFQRELATFQENNSQALAKELKKAAQTPESSKEKSEEETFIQEVKLFLYDELWIQEDMSQNSSFENFLKWIIDELIVNNYDLAVQIWETKWEIILDALGELASWEGVKSIAAALGESLWTLWDGNAYEKWKSVAELWLVWTWVGAGVYVWKKSVKAGIKQVMKVRKARKTSPSSSLGSFNFEKWLIEDITKLWDKERIEAAEAFLKRKIPENQQKAILEAHRIWDKRDWAWVYTYSRSEIAEKVRILQEAWLSEEERRVLLEKGVCGREVPK